MKREKIAPIGQNPRQNGLLIKIKAIRNRTSIQNLGDFRKATRIFFPPDRAVNLGSGVSVEDSSAFSFVMLASIIARGMVASSVPPGQRLQKKKFSGVVLSGVKSIPQNIGIKTTITARITYLP